MTACRWAQALTTPWHALHLEHIAVGGGDGVLFQRVARLADDIARRAHALQALPAAEAVAAPEARRPRPGRHVLPRCRLRQQHVTSITS
jgi:hypothetical protein